jgi:hypothetical protein
MAAEEDWFARDQLALFSSISLALFVAFKLFSLFLVPAHLVLGLFLAVHPLGILIGARYFRDPGARPSALYGCFLVLCLTLLGITLLRRVTPTLDPPWLGGGYPIAEITRVVLTCGVVLAPLSLMSGILEYLLLSSSRRRQGSYTGGYSLLLASAVLGLLIGYVLLARAGMLGLCAIVIALGAAGAFPKLGRGFALVFVLCAVVVARSPQLDSRFVLAISPSGPHTARGQVERGAELARAVWDPHAYTQILKTRDRTYGAYDNLVYWTVSPKLEPARGPDVLVYSSLVPNARLAIIGVGGGAQVKDAVQLRDDISIDAFEINRSVVDYFVREDPDANGSVFRNARVSPRAEEGRAGVSRETYDAIYLPEAGTVLGYYRALALDLNFIHTEDAYRGYLSRLRPGGILCAAFAEYSDPGRRMTRRLLATLERLGLSARGFDDGHYRVVIATRPESAKLLELASQSAAQSGLESFTRDTEPLPSDDFGASQILVYTERSELLRAFVISALSMSLLALGFVSLFSRRRTGVSGSWIRFTCAAGLGAAFVLLENSAILLLARTLFSLADAVIVGSVAFLGVALIGARFAEVLAHQRRGLTIVGLAAAIQAGSLFAPTPLLAFAGTLVLGVGAGALLPLLLGSWDAERMPGLFACDSGGALLGVVIAFFVPLLFGMTVFGLLVAAVYVVLGALVVLLSKNDLSRPRAAAG